MYIYSAHNSLPPQGKLRNPQTRMQERQTKTRKRHLGTVAFRHLKPQNPQSTESFHLEGSNGASTHLWEDIGLLTKQCAGMPRNASTPVGCPRQTNVGGATYRWLSEVVLLVLGSICLTALIVAYAPNNTYKNNLWQ